MFNLYSLLRFDVVKSRISFWSDFLIVFFLFFVFWCCCFARRLCIYEFMLTRNFRSREEFQFDIDAFRWHSHESDDYFWRMFYSKWPEREGSKVTDTRSRKDNSENLPSHDIHDSKLYQITHEKKKQARERRNRDRARCICEIYFPNVVIIFQRKNLNDALLRRHKLLTMRRRKIHKSNVQQSLQRRN